jgi:polyisoprenoid-binding protein YceI
VPSRRTLRWLRWAAAGVAAVVVLAVGGTYVYIHFIEGPAPAPFSLKPAATSPPEAASQAPGRTTASSLAGTWQVTAGSQAGYRVKEVLLGQNNIAVGRTSHVTGQLTVNGAAVTAASFSVQMATIHSDQSERDVQFDGRIMDVAQFPVSTFRLTHPISLGTVPAGTVKTYSATGKLTMHGHTRQVAFALKAERTGGKIEVTGSIPVVFADYDIGNPSFGSFVTTQNHGVLEFLIDLSQQ